MISHCFVYIFASLQLLFTCFKLRWYGLFCIESLFLYKFDFCEITLLKPLFLTQKRDFPYNLANRLKLRYFGVRIFTVVARVLRYTWKKKKIWFLYLKHCFSHFWPNFSSEYHPLISHFIPSTVENRLFVQIVYNIQHVSFILSIGNIRMFSKILRIIFFL